MTVAVLGTTTLVRRPAEVTSLSARSVEGTAPEIDPQPSLPPTGGEDHGKAQGGIVFQSVKSVWSSGRVTLLWQRSWAVSSHLMYPRRPHDGSSGSPLSQHTHVPQFSVREGRGAPPKNGACTSPHKPPAELTQAESAQYETNKSSTHKYKTYNKCIGKCPKLSPNAQQGNFGSNGIAEPCSSQSTVRFIKRRCGRPSHCQ